LASWQGSCCSVARSASRFAVASGLALYIYVVKCSHLLTDLNPLSVCCYWSVPSGPVCAVLACARPCGAVAMCLRLRPLGPIAWALSPCQLSGCAGTCHVSMRRHLSLRSTQVLCGHAACRCTGVGDGGLGPSANSGTGSWLVCAFGCDCACQLDAVSGAQAVSGDGWGLASNAEAAGCGGQGAQLRQLGWLRPWLCVWFASSAWFCWGLVVLCHCTQGVSVQHAPRQNWPSGCWDGAWVARMA
jgi:hypothetical protein